MGLQKSQHNWTTEHIAMSTTPVAFAQQTSCPGNYLLQIHGGKASPQGYEFSANSVSFIYLEENDKQISPGKPNLLTI